jgi:hypothetical protein
LGERATEVIYNQLQGLRKVAGSIPAQDMSFLLFFSYIYFRKTTSKKHRQTLQQSLHTSPISSLDSVYIA